MHLSLLVKSELVPIFFQLLGHGFNVDVKTGCSVKELLCKQLGISEDYLNRRIQTIFLNAKVVDDVNSAVVNEGATLALSGAMPGLVGAILRSGGFYAAMRSQISHHENKLYSQGQTAQITLKLLNLVVKELGPIFLQQGIRMKGQTLQEFTERYAKELASGCITGEMNGQPLERIDLQGINWGTDQVLLQVSSEQAA
ncbi:MAG: hypothetical protein JSW26_28700 [Desulfobacterales bacterium]|nr:MAG: hypothetical protein JSW26_28700 [Desulfobacterales bacterium]